MLTPLQRLQFEALQSSSDHGLEPADYAVSRLQHLLAEGTAEAAIQFNQLLNQAFVEYSDDVRSGRLRASVADADWTIPRPADEPAPPVLSTANAAALAGFIETLPPQNPDYQRLKAALEKYRAIARDGAWPSLPPGPDLRQGMRHEQVVPLRNRLRITGDYTGEMQADPLYFDAGIAQAVRRFQTRHGLSVSATVDERTRKALNVTVGERIRQLKLSMERWRWLPPELGERYVWVNVADADLQVVENGRPVLSMRAIVGRPYRQTPSFRGEMNRVVFNPSWTVPHTIAVQDLLPQQQQDPEFLSRKAIHVYRGWGENGTELDPGSIDWAALGPDNFPYRLRQEPGPANSLGRIKFVFDNPYDIYLHDTPVKPLFELPLRTFSSGCIRIEKPVELAAYLLQNEGFRSRTDIEAQIDRQTSEAIRLERQIPVYVVYMTSWVSPDGMVHFRRDVYGRDERMRLAWELKSGIIEQSALDGPYQ